MITEHKLVGLSAGRRGTFRNSRDDCFWADFDMEREVFKDLFTWAKSDEGFWKQNIIATIEHEKLSEDGTPIAGKIIQIEIL